jgi:hypothetical protein
MPDRKILVAGILFLALLAGLGPAQAQRTKYQGVRGTLVDAAGAPLSGHRVVFTPEGGGQSYVSQPTRPDGTFVVSVPDAATVLPIAVLDPRGSRTELADQEPFQVVEGLQITVKMPPVEGAAAPQGENLNEVTGRILDPDGKPLPGHRVVFRTEGGYEVRLSDASDQNGAYSAELPSRGLYVPEALIDPRGRRWMLTDDNPLQAIPGAKRDITFVVPPGTNMLPEPSFPGADRLFVSFAEDVPVVEHYRGEFRLDYGSFDDWSTTTGELVGAIQIPGLPDVELGARVGYGNSDPDGLSSESGATDLDVWGKLRAGPRADGSDYGFGFVMSFPTGEEAPGLGADSLGVKLFYTSRHPLGWAVLSWNAGVQVNEDGKVYGVRLDGEIAPVGGVALIFAPRDDLGVIAELYASGERFEEGDADVRLLGGVNWKIRDYLHLRGALTLGLSDGAPSPGVTAGVSFDY